MSFFDCGALQGSVLFTLSFNLQCQGFSKLQKICVRLGVVILGGVEKVGLKLWTAALFTLLNKGVLDEVLKASSLQLNSWS